MGLLARLFSTPLSRRKRRAAERAQSVARIRAVLDETGPEAAWRELRRASYRDPASNELLRVAAHVLRHEKELRVAELFDRAADAPHDPRRLLELGNALLSREEPRLAAQILTRALAFVPFDAIVRSELALAHARSGRPDEVLEALALHPCLAEDPGALFEFGWASMLVGDLKAANGVLREMSPGHPLRDKLRLALERAKLMPEAVSSRGARDYYFVEHGGLLLDDAGPSAGRYLTLDLDERWWARTLAHLRHALAGSEIQHVVILDGAHEPLARLVAQTCGLEMRARGKGRLPAGLVPILSGDVLSQLEPQDLRSGSSAVFFAVTVDPTRTLSRAPEIIGAFACEVSGALPPHVEPGAPDDAFLSFVEERRGLVAPNGERARSAFVPDAPLPALDDLPE